MVKIKHVISPICVGIDFGTTCSGVSYYDGTSFSFVQFESSPLKPSWIKSGQRYIKAIKRLISNPEEYLGETKMEDGIQYLRVDSEWKPTIELIAEFFLGLRHSASEHFKEDIRNAVITVPARFDEKQKQTIVEAATQAGWRALRILAEPTAAFLAHYRGGAPKKPGIYGVYDLGGGTFDFSLIRVDLEVIQVLATTGDLSIGGDYFDLHLSQAKLSEMIYTGIRADAEISEALLAQFSPEDYTQLRHSGYLHPASMDMIKYARGLVEKLLAEFQIQPDSIILTGGCASMRSVSESVKALGYPVQISDTPQLDVLKGAAIHAHNLSQDNLYLLLDSVPLSLGIETKHGLVEHLIPRYTMLPAAKAMVITNTDSKQTHILLNIVQGESSIAAECRSLGKFKVEIEPMPAHTAQLEVQFILDTSGMLSIRCQNLLNRSVEKFTLASGEGLTQAMVDRITKIGEENLWEKHNARQLLETLDSIDIILRSVAKDLPELDLSIYKAERQALTELPEAEALLEELELEFMEFANQKLCRAVQKLY